MSTSLSLSSLLCEDCQINSDVTETYTNGVTTRITTEIIRHCQLHLPRLPSPPAPPAADMPTGKPTISNLGPLFSRYRVVLILFRRTNNLKSACTQAGIRYSTFVESMKVCELNILVPSELHRLQHEMLQLPNATIAALNKKAKLVLQDPLYAQEKEHAIATKVIITTSKRARRPTACRILG